MDRILRGTAATVSITFTVDGVPTDPSPATATLGIAGEDGTVLLAPGAAATRSSVGVFTYNLTPAQTAQLDVLAIDWTATIQGSSQTLRTYVEVAGGFLFDLATARNLSPLQNATTYPTADVVFARTVAESALEHACGVAFVPRYGREYIDGPPGGGTDVLLTRPRPLSITSATDTGAVVSPSTLSLYRDGRVYNAAKWTEGRQNIVIKFTHGHLFTPPRVSRACLLLAKRFLVDTPISDRATMLQNQDGTTEYLVTAGVRDAMFDIPECNAVVTDYGLSFGVG